MKQKFAPNPSIPSQSTPLQTAVQNDDAAAVRAIIEGANPPSAEQAGHALLDAAINNSLAVAEVLLGHSIQPYFISKGLLCAAETHRLQMAQLLLQNGADTCYRQQNTPFTALECAASGGDQEMVALLIAHGADVASDIEILATAALDGRTEILRLLLLNGATSYDDQRLSTLLRLMAEDAKSKLRPIIPASSGVRLEEDWGFGEDE